MFTCDLCNKPFKSRRSLASHRNHHNPEYRKKSSEAVRFLLTPDVIERSKEGSRRRSISLWESRNHRCLSCGETLTYPETKACSDACYSQYRSSANARVHSEETKRKISQSAQSRWMGPPKPKNLGASETFFKFIVCKVCGLQRTRNGKRCPTPSCVEVYRDNLSKKLKLAYKEGRHLGNYYRNRSNPSFLERSFIDFLSSHYPQVPYEHNYTVRILNDDGTFKTNYFIDFYFPSTHQGLELDGKQHEEQQEYDAQRDKEILSQAGILILRVTYDEFFGKEKYDEIQEIILGGGLAE